MADKYAHLKEVKKKQKDLQKILSTVDLEHTKAYVKAADEHLRDEKGRIDYSKLEKVSVQRKYADTMADHYRDKVMKRFKLKDIDEFEENNLLHGFYGITRQELRHRIATHGPEFTQTKYIREHAPKLIKALTERLAPITSSHLKDEHIKDIIDYTKTGDLIDPDTITLDQAIELLLNNYHALGAVPPNIIPKHLKKKKKK